MNFFKNRGAIIVSKDKAINYLLNATHPDGGSKAKLFISCGFHPENWEDFVEKVRDHAQAAEVISEYDTPFGLKIVLMGLLETPSKRSLSIVSVWNVQKNIPILVTLYPAKR